jgi:hypothetical protein
MMCLTKITSIEEKKKVCEKINQNSEKYAFIMRELVGLLGLTYFSVA